MTDLSTWDGCWEQAKENTSRDEVALEHQCRAIAKYLGVDEELWQSQVDLVIAVEAGRLMAVHAERMTPEWQEGFRNYMMNR